ncbi:site-specific integrase [Rhodocyclaceae bacterium]
MLQIDTLTPPKPLPFCEFASLYLSSVRNRLKSIHQLEFRIKKFVRRFDSKPVNEIRRVDISEYIDERLKQGINPGTINLEISAVSSAYRHAVNIWGWNLQNPVIGQQLRQPEGRLRYLTETEKRDLFNAATYPKTKPYLVHFLNLAINTGCRKSELLKLTWRDVDMTIPAITITSANSKNGKRRIIPLNKAATDSINQLFRMRNQHNPSSPWVFTRDNGKPLRCVDNAFKRACKRAGIQDFRIHDLRHTFASDLVKAGVSLYHVKKLLGHSSINQTERYAHLATDALTQAVTVLDEINKAR